MSMSTLFGAWNEQGREPVGHGDPWLLGINAFSAPYVAQDTHVNRLTNCAD